MHKNFTFIYHCFTILLQFISEGHSIYLNVCFLDSERTISFFMNTLQKTLILRGLLGLFKLKWTNLNNIKNTFLTNQNRLKSWFNMKETSYVPFKKKNFVSKVRPKIHLKNFVTNLALSLSIAIYCKRRTRQISI